MTKYLVSAILALFLLAGVHLAARAGVIGTHSNETHSILLHDVKGDCADGLQLAQIIDKTTKAVTVTGCWMEFNDKVGILWEGDTFPRIGLVKYFTWAKT